MSDGHVVGDEVEDDSHAEGAQRVGKRGKLFVGAEFRIDLVVVGDVVAVLAAGTRLQNG